MVILKTAGAILFILGVLLGVYTFVSSRKGGLFDDLTELKRIRETGYTKEHHEEERREDIYKRETNTAPQARLLSRRAQRVLERMNEAENAAAAEDESAKGAAILEEVVPKGATRSEPAVIETKNAPPSGAFSGKLIKRPARRKKTSSKEQLTAEPAPVQDTGEGTDVLAAAPDEGTDILKKEAAPSEEGTAILSRDASEGTDILERTPSEGTDILNAPPEEGTDVLMRNNLEGTDILRRPQGETTDEPAKDYGEGTDFLDPSAAAAGGAGQPCDEGTDILVRPSSEGTDVLPGEPSGDTYIPESPHEDEATGILMQPSGEGTDILPASARSENPPKEEGTDILYRPEEEATGILPPSKQAGYADLSNEPSDDEKGTDILDSSSEGTDILNTSEDTDILERR